MAWSESLSARNRKSKLWLDPDTSKGHVTSSINSMHYEGAIDSGTFDSEYDFTLVRVDRSDLDGYEITTSDWFFAIQTEPRQGQQPEQGSFGFGGRRGEHWVWQRLAQMGYVHRPTETPELITNVNYDAANISIETNTNNIGPVAQPFVRSATITWANVAQIGAGFVSIVWELSPGGIIEKIHIDPVARAAIPVPSNGSWLEADTYLGFVAEVDYTDIPRRIWRSNNQGNDADFWDDGDAVFLENANQTLLGVLPATEVYVVNRGGNAPIVRRFHRQGNQQRIVFGVRLDEYSTLLPGEIVFDPPINSTIADDNEDGYEDVYNAFNYSYNNRVYQGNYSASNNSMDAVYRFEGITGPASGDTVDASTGTLTLQRRAGSGTVNIDVDCDVGANRNTQPSNTHRPDSGWTAGTSVSTTVVGGASGGGSKVTGAFTAALQSLIDLAGWVSGDDICIAVRNGAGNSNGTMLACDSGGGGTPAQLDFTYTAAGGGDITEEPLLGELDLLGLAPGILVDIGVPAGTADTDGLLPTLGFTIAVPAGSLTIDTTGTVPTAEITHTRQIPAVTPLLITPAAPSAEITHIRGPPQGELQLTGQLPTIAITISVPVPLGELDLLGLASSANVTHNRAVPAGSASLTGLTETLDTAYGVPADALALAGLLPTISVESGAVVEEPPAGSLALTGLAPDIGGTVTIAVAKGELVIFSGLGLQLRGITPTIAVTGNIVSEPPADTLALTGLQSTAETEHTRQMGAGSLALATLQPSAETEHTRQVPAGSAALTGQLPTISVGVGSATAEPLLGSLTLAGKTPALEIIISNADSSLFFTGQAPTPLQNASPPDIITSPGDGSLTLAGLVPERASGLLLTGLAPTVLGDRQVLPEDGALTLTGLTPTVFGENPTIEVPVGSLSINGLQPSLPDFVAPGTGALTLTGLQPRFEGPQQASPPPDNLVLTGYAPTIVVPTPGKAKAGGRRRGRKPRKFSIEIDGELFVVNTVMEAIDLLRVAKQEAKTAPLPVKKPRIRIVGTASKTARLEVERAQRVVSRTFSKRLDAEIAGLMRESEARQKANTARIKRGMVRAKKRAADDEEAIAVLLLLS